MKKSSWIRGIVAAASGICLAVALSACQGTPAAKSKESTAVDSPRMKVALITHAAPGDTFWDIIRKGAETAAAKDNIELQYLSDPDGGRQAQLIQQAVDQKVDAIAVTLAKPDAVGGAVKAAVAAGIPVVSLDSGEEYWKDLGILGHFGQNEELGGEAVGEQLNKLGAKKAVCVIHEQGQVALESRCEGVKKTFGGQSEVLYVSGVDMTNVSSTITSKLQTNTDIDYVITLGAPVAMTALDSVKDAGSKAKVATFDMNPEAIKAVQSGKLQFIVDAQPYLQGYEAIDNIWLYKTNGNVLGGGQVVLTGPQIIDASNIDSIAKFGAKGTR